MSLEEYDNELEIVEKYFLKSDEGRQKECYYFIGDIIEQTDVRIPPKSGINVEQALALRFYCCYTNLSAKFSATFRKLPNELCEDLIKRNSEFHHWSKHLYEAIHLFGDDVINKQFGDYVYHGIDEPMIFETIVGWMYGPISTTGKKAVAFNFAANGNGLVLQLNTYHNIPNFYSFFNCRCISDFAAEDEKLFLHVQLRIESIYHMPLEQIYIEECQAIDILYNILTAQEMINIDIVSDKHIEYYESMMKQEYDKYPPYINKLFNNIISPITEISINLWLMNQDQYKYVNYGHESVKHGYKKLKPFFMNASNDFLYIDKLCKLCPNVGNIRFYNQVKAKSERKDNDLHSDHSSKCVVLNDDFLSELLLCKPTSKSLRRIVIVDPDETMMTIKQFTQRYYSKTTDYTKRFRLSGCKTLTLSANIDQYDLSDVWYYEHFDRISHILRNAQIQNGHNFEYCVGVDFGYEDMRVGICDIKTQTIYSEKQIRNWSVWDLKNRSLQTLKYILSKIIKIFPKYGISLEDITKIQWILTVPTIWSEKAKLTIMTTAYDAGLISPYIRNHIRIIDEPNCAAFDCLNNPETIYPITFDASSNDEKIESKEKNRAIVDEIFHMISNNNPTHNEENDILKTVTSHRSNDGRVWNNLEVEQIVSVYIGYNTFSAAFCPLGYPSHLRIVQDWSGAKAAAEHDSSDTINQNMVALLIDKETNATIAFGWKAEELYMKAQEKKETDKFMYFNQFKQHLYGKNVSDKTIQSVNGTSSISLSVLATKLFQAIAQYSLNSINGLNKLAGIDLQTTKQMYWVLTVPTSWYQSSIELIETSMKNVGMEHYETISEPVASAFHFLNCSYKKSQQTVYLLVECNEHTTNATALVIDDRLYFKVLYCDEFEALSGSIEDKFKSVLTELLPSDIITPIIENQPHQWIRQMQEFYLAKRSVPYEFEDEDAWNVPF
eukprot:430266_1